MAEPQSNAVTPHPKASVILIAPDAVRRAAIAGSLVAAHARVVRELADFPNGGKLVQVLDTTCDAILVDLHSEAETGLALIETICSQSVQVTVMALAHAGDAEVLIRAMRAGAREFFTEPLSVTTLGEALERAATRRRNAAPHRNIGKLMVFRGAKGGSGVTTLATNFAISLTQESHNGVVLVDLHPQLGEVALSLGVEARFSIADALANASRLDGDFPGHLTDAARLRLIGARFARRPRRGRTKVSRPRSGKTIPRSARGIRIRGSRCRVVRRQYSGRSVRDGRHYLSGDRGEPSGAPQCKADAFVFRRPEYQRKCGTRSQSLQFSYG